MAGLAHPQLVTDGLEGRAIDLLIGRVVDLDQDVDDRLGGQTRDRGGADVLDAPNQGPEGAADPVALGLEAIWLRLVVVDDGDSGSLDLLGLQVSGSCDKFQAAVPRRAPVM